MRRSDALVADQPIGDLPPAETTGNQLASLDRAVLIGLGALATLLVIVAFCALTAETFSGACQAILA